MQILASSHDTPLPPGLVWFGKAQVLLQVHNPNQRVSCMSHAAPSLFLGVAQSDALSVHAPRMQAAGEPSFLLI